MRRVFCPGCLYSEQPHFQGCKNLIYAMQQLRVFPFGFIDAVLEDHEGERKKHLSDIELVNQNVRGK